jgi:hypothetical protein
MSERSVLDKERYEENDADETVVEDSEDDLSAFDDPRLEDTT